MNKEGIFVLARASGLKLHQTMKAIHKATRKHEGQQRDDGTDYVEHPIRVCRMLLNFGIYDDATLAASLRHDEVEDKRSTLVEIRNDHTDEVGTLVDGMTKRSGENKEDYLKRVALNIKTILIKVLDRICNIENMTSVYRLERLVRYVEETEEILKVMKEARRDYPEYADMLVICRDYIKGILKEAREIIALKQEVIAKDEVIANQQRKITELEARLIT